MKKGNILYIGGFELPDKNAAAHRVLNNGKALKKLGYNVIFIGVNKTLAYNTDASQNCNKIQGFENWDIPYPKKNKEWVNYLTSIKRIVEITEKYSNVKAIICYNYQSFAFIKLIKFCKLKDIRVIADCTEWYGAQGSNIFMKFIKGIDSFIRMRILHKNIYGLIVISKYLEKYYKKHSNLILVPPLVDLSEDKWQQKKKSKIEEEKIKIVYSGSPGRKKDKINVIIKALWQFREEISFKFIVIGINVDDYLNIYPNDNIMLEQMKDKIVFLGEIQHINSLNFLKEADYSIFIRDNNLINKAGFPTKFVESISCGTPVITNRTSNIDDFLKIGVNGYFISKNNLTNDLRFIFSDNDIKLEIIKKNMIVSSFDFRNFIFLFKNLLEK